ncbi:MAG: efflux RND transporter periplasmic adaptor subunit [Gammaproteobacteria bacterium]|nr:efflux RND transporter periplasmic adaptor subunit [Gammaproteobacteria bacterium]
MVSGRGIVHPRAPGIGRALTILLLVATAIGCEQAPLEEQTIVRPVRYMQVVAEGASEARTYSGAARAEVETDLSFRVGGTLTQRPVDVGDEIDQGDLVAMLDSTDFRVRLDEARAGLARAEAEQRNADANYDRTRDLYESQNAPRGELDSARALAESAEAQYRAAGQQVEAARLQLSYSRLTAPQACTVAETFVEVNQNVSPGQPVVRLNCGGCAEVVVSVSDTDISRVQRDMEVTASVTALPGNPIPGVVREVGVATGARSTTYPVTIALMETCEDVRSGMAVDVRFEFPTTAAGDNPVVPYVAVGEDRDGNYVFVIESDESGVLRAIRRPVEVGRATSTGIVIVDGLRPGELIATAGIRRLSPGQEVTLLGSPESTGP